MNSLIVRLVSLKNFFASKLGKESFIAIGGMALEYHNIFLFGYLASVITPNFFAKSSSLITIQAILVSFIMGPLGAIFCGHVGDTLGRRRILVWALAFVSVSTFFMSVLPTYDQIGISASILFVILRSIQILGFGGDAVGLATFILEEAPPEHRGFYGGLMSFGSAFGVFFASLEIAILDPLADPFSSWKWRSPLSLGVIGIFISIYFFKIIKESPIFQHYDPDEVKASFPLVELLKTQKNGFIKSIGIFCLAPIITLIIFSFIPYLGLKSLGLSSRYIMWTNTLSVMVFMISAPLFGAMSDRKRVGRKPILISVSLVLLVLGFPLFYFFEYHSAFTYVCIQAFFSWVASAYYGIAMTTNIEHLPTHLRYTGVALSFTVSYALFGGTVGLHVVKFLIEDAKLDIFPSFYLLFGALVVLFFSIFLKEKARKPLGKIRD